MTTRKLTFDFCVLSWGAEVNGTCTGVFTSGEDDAAARGTPDELDVHEVTIDELDLLPPGDRSRFVAEFYGNLLLAAGDAWAEQEQLDRDSIADAKRGDGWVEENFAGKLVVSGKGMKS